MKGASTCAGPILARGTERSWTDAEETLRKRMKTDEVTASDPETDRQKEREEELRRRRRRRRRRQRGGREIKTKSEQRRSN